LLIFVVGLILSLEAPTAHVTQDVLVPSACEAKMMITHLAFAKDFGCAWKAKIHLAPWTYRKAFIAGFMGPSAATFTIIIVISVDFANVTLLIKAPAPAVARRAAWQVTKATGSRNRVAAPHWI
jgi:hypothetical protein